MNNKSALIISGAIIMTFFLIGTLDIIYEWDILGNLVTKILLFGALLCFIGYLIKANISKHKKNLP